MWRAPGPELTDSFHVRFCETALAAGEVKPGGEATKVSQKKEVRPEAVQGVASVEAGAPGRTECGRELLVLLSAP